MSIYLQLGDSKSASHPERLHGGIDEPDRPIEEHYPHFHGWSGMLPGDTYLSAAQRVLKELRELEQYKAAKGMQV
jgi:hypothetical protein